MSLVERDAEVERIRSALASARAGAGGAVVAVTGQPGAGKSALLREALAEGLAYWGWCEPGMTPRPLGPFRDVLRSGAIGSRVVADDVDEALLDAMRAAPLVLVVEDAHWIDAASASTLRFLGRRIHDSKGVVLLSYRDTIGPDHVLRSVLADLATAPALERVVLGPLTEAGVADLLEGTGRDATEAHRVTGGNAFLVCALRDAPEEELSASVRDLAWSWARRLDPGPLDLLKELAVLPGRIPLEDVRDRAGDLDALVTAGILRPDAAHLEFRHELVRRALDAELSAEERLRAHDAAYARLLSRPEAEPSELAFHALRAGRPDEALVHERAAAGRAIASKAHLQAVEHLRRAVELAEGRLDAAELARTCMQLAEHEYFVGHDADARRYAAKALALTDPADPLLHARALMARSRVAASEKECLEFAERALPLLEAIGGVELAEACAHLATRRMVARDLEAAEQWARRALDMVGAEERPDIVVNALQALGSALTLGGRDDACAHLRDAVELGTRAGVDTVTGLAHCNLISAAGEARLYAVVDDAAPAALDFFEHHDLDALDGYTRAWIGRCELEQGRWERALQRADSVMATRHRSSDISVIAALLVRGRVQARRGDPAAAATLAEAREMAGTTGSLQRVAPAASATAELAWLTGTDLDPAILRDALALALDRGNAGYAAELSVWLGRFGEPVTVVGAPEPWASWLAGDVSGAGERWLALGCPYEAADAFSGSTDPEVLRRALEIVDDLGAPPLRARIVRALRELGERSIPRGPRRETAEDAQGLTAREQEVLTWLRTGSTDAEIAAGLHLSVKTVGHHVSAILRKTRSASRRDLRG
ncbi:MAG: AAA family ATPase [Marmoricola sp.]